MKKPLFYFVKKKYRGFTLVELAIVLVIFGLIIATFLSPLSIQREIQGRRETLDILNESKEALIGYALINGHLPCPDSKPIPDGLESRGGADCVDDEGVMPWGTLGIERVDAWNHYIRYRVDATFSKSDVLFTIANAEGFSTIQINGEAGVSLVSLNSRPVAVLISHGSNGFGAINTIQTTNNKQPMPTGADELQNANSNTTFVSHVPTPSGTVNEFDDILLWISPKVLINRMVAAEKLPS